jgi:hypothetical protein
MNELNQNLRDTVVAVYSVNCSWTHKSPFVVAQHSVSISKAQDPLQNETNIIVCPVVLPRHYTSYKVSLPTSLGYAFIIHSVKITAR